MAERYQGPLIIDFRGGLRTDMIPQVHFEKWQQDPWFSRCENRLFEQSGAARKVGGSTRINSTAITDSPNIMGMYDFWLTGAAGSFTQKFMAVTSDSKIYKEDMDGTFDEITGAASITANAVDSISGMDEDCSFPDFTGNLFKA